MSNPKFIVGERVILQPDASNMNVRSGAYTIVRVLPNTDRGFQYRARHAMDNHERVLDEGELRKG